MLKKSESLQTHCWYATDGVDQTVHFGTATKDEMCQDFLYYYPAQFRGTNSNGDAERFSMCGLWTGGNKAGHRNGEADTLCGSLSQSGTYTYDGQPYPNFVVVGGQVDRGNTRYADPLNFGSKNKAAAASTTKSTCTATNTTITTAFTLSGSVTDYDETKQVAISKTIADAAGVATSAVQLVITAASVQVTAIITVAGSSGSAVVASLTGSGGILASANALQLALAANGLSGVTVESAPTAGLTSSISPPPPAPPAPPPAGPSYAVLVAHALCMSLAWGLLAPVGAITPRAFKKLMPGGGWFRVHWMVQTTAVLLTVVGLVLAIIQVEQTGARDRPLASPRLASPRLAPPLLDTLASSGCRVTHVRVPPSFVSAGTPHFGSAHKATGLVVVILALMQPLIALVRPKKPQAGAAPTMLRKIWRVKHALLGCTLLVLGIVQLLLGVPAFTLVTRQPGDYWYGVYFGLLGVAAVWGLVGFALSSRASSQVTDKKQTV